VSVPVFLHNLQQHALVVGLEVRNLGLREAVGVLRRTVLPEASTNHILHYTLNIWQLVEYGLGVRHELQDALTEVTEDIGPVQVLEQLLVHWLEHPQVVHQRPGQASDERGASTGHLNVDFDTENLILGAVEVAVWWHFR